MRSSPVRRALAPALALVLLWTGSTPADDQLKVDVLKKVKLATVRLRVVLADGTQVEGSGFFGLGAGFVLTNAHVLGMLRPESPKPRKVEIILNSGEPDEKTLLGKTLGVDSGSDLGLLVVPPKDAPPSLEVVNADNLQETQSLYVIGFPFGEALGKNVTVTKTTVSSLRKNEYGRVAKIQVNGGMNPGNSGGPVIDADGKVVGVAVSGIKGTQINFAIPSRLVHNFLSGHVHNRVSGVPYKDADAVKLPMTIQTIDPLNRLRKVRIDCWSGDPGKPRNIAEKDRAPLPGESPRKSTDLEYKNGVAKGEIVLPEMAAGKVLWYEVHTVDLNNREVWTIAAPLTLEPPLDRKPTTIAYKHQAGKRGWRVVSETALKLRDADGDDHDVVIKRESDVIQILDDKTTPIGEATGTLLFAKPAVKLSLDGKELPLQQQDVTLKQIDQLRTTVRINAQGQYVSYRPDLKAVPKELRERVNGFVEELLKSFDAAKAPLPSEQMTFGKPWKGTRELMIGSVGPAETAAADLTYSYLGTNERFGRNQAIVSLEGRLRGQKGEGFNVAGKIRGDATFDLETGQVLAANTTVDVDFETGVGARKSKAGGTLTVHLYQIVYKSEAGKK